MRFLHALAWLVAAVAIGAAAYLASAPAAEDPFVVYRETLERLGSVTPPAPGSREEAAALERFQRFVTNLSAEHIRRETASVYAPEAVLSDTLAVLYGSDAIEAYFLRNAERGVDVTVDVADVVRSGDDFYVRWTMHIRSSSFGGGEPLSSAGMTHLRLGADGRVLLHYDFWDSGHGLFEHVPGTRGLMRRIRARLH